MRRDSVRTPQPGTDTTHGRIPHLKVVTPYGVVEAPVSVEVLPSEDRLKLKNGDALRLRPRMNEFGRYLHVLPGGSLIAGSYASGM